MSTEKPTETKRTCFVVMGFGKKSDYQSEPIRQLDLDKTYRNIIKPVAEEVGLKCVRADELVHSGLIDLAMYEQLLSADVVIADLSTSNSNAFYELGVRHALRPYTTIVICEEGLMKEGRDKLPFDVNHIVVRRYNHMGDGIDYEEVMRFSKVLKEDIRQILERQPPVSDSPVYTFIKGLNPPGRVAEEVGRGLDEALGGAQPAEEERSADTHSALMERVEDAIREGDYDFAKTLLADISKRRPDDPCVTQRLVVATYKSRSPTTVGALEEARDLLKTLNPDRSSDPWTLGLWGTVHERLWEETGDPECLDKAMRGYERGFNQRRDYFNGIHQAFLLNVRAAKANDPAEAVADFVLARRIRREVLPICHEWLDSTKEPTRIDDGKRELNEYLEEKYWVLTTIAEAHMGTDDDEQAGRYFDEAEAVLRQLEVNRYPASKIAKTRAATAKKRADLKALLADSPLKYVGTQNAPPAP